MGLIEFVTVSALGLLALLGVVTVARLFWGLRQANQFLWAYLDTCYLVGIPPSPREGLWTAFRVFLWEAQPGNPLYCVTIRDDQHRSIGTYFPPGNIWTQGTVDRDWYYETWK